MVKTGVFILILAVLVVVVGALFLFGGFNKTGQQQEPISVIVTDNAVESSEAEQEEDSFESTPGGDALPNPVKEFTMTAEQWEFTPSTITVSEGDLVALTITSIDVSHGFAIPEFGVNEILEPGKTLEVEFVADKKGTFRFYCSVYCGVGHSGMDGTLIVE